MYKLDVKTLPTYSSNLATGNAPNKADERGDHVNLLVAGRMNQTTSNQNVSEMTKMKINHDMTSKLTKKQKF